MTGTGSLREPKERPMPNYVGVEEYAKALGITVHHAYVRIRKGDCPPFTRRGRRIRFKVEDLQRYMGSDEDFTETRE